MIRSVRVVLVGIVVTLRYTLAVVWRALAGRLTPCDCERAAREWGRAIIRASGSTVEIEGLERYDPEMPHILVSNHVSWFDVFAVCGYLPGHFRFVAKQELTRIPLFGRAFRQCGHVSIDRSDRSSAIASLDEAGRRIRAENLDIVMFAEGTRSADGTLRPFKKGAFVLAIESGVPIQPVAILGTRDIMPKGSFRVTPGTIRIRLGDEIPVAGLEDTDRERLRVRTHAAVAALLGQAPPEGAAMAGTGPDPDPVR